MARSRKILVAATAAVISLGLVAPAVADERGDLANQMKDNSSQLEELHSQLEGVDVSLQETYLQLEATRNRIPDAEAELAQAEEDLAAAQQVQQVVADRMAVADNELQGIAGEIQASQEQMAQSRDSLAALARATYQNGGLANQDPMALLFDSDSTDDFLTQYTALDSAVRSQTAVLNEMSALEATQRNAEARQESVLERIEELKVAADKAVADADAARAEAAAKRQELADLEGQQARLATSLESQKDAIERQQASIEADNADLRNRIAAIDEENRRRAAEEAARQQANQGGGTAGAGGAAFIPPVPQPLYVTSPYGYRVYPITGGWFMHYGVDLRSACGNQQVAAASGTVADVRGAYGNGTHGNQVIINHGYIDGSSWITVYNHLSSFAVSKGQSIGQGQVFGYTGATGNVTGCHVHMEVWKDGVSIDPMTLPAF